MKITTKQARSIRTSIEIGQNLARAGYPTLKMMEFGIRHRKSARDRSIIKHAYYAKRLAS